MNKPVVIVGAGRQGRNIAEILEGAEAPGPVAGFLDDTKAIGEKIFGHPVLNGFAALRDPRFVLDHAWIVAIGDNWIRRDLYRALADADAAIVSAVHRTAAISRGAILGRGLFIGPLSSVGAETKIGDWSVLEAHVRVGVDVRIGEAAFLGPGAITTGGSSVGANSFLGAGTIVNNNTSVGADCIIGANSVVTRDLPDGTSAYGAPARPAPLRRRPFDR
jgi:sugar O-acyltransferase (sialic acid O-acetyltransferase NeuD family)